MKINCRIKLVIFLAACLPALLSGQISLTGMPAVTSNLDNYRVTNPFEELWLHTDRECYVAGEMVRVRAYLLSYPDLTVSKKDSYAYVELLDYYNNPVAQVTIMLGQGTGDSQFLLPDSLVSGSYLLRAYTNVMKNYLPYGCFMKKITVANPFREDFLDLYSSLKFSHDPPSKVFFFPEGGTLVSGLLTKVGVTVLNQYGYPAACSALVTDTNNEVIAEVTVDTTGIGSFDFVPVQGAGYFFTPSGTGQQYPLPPVSPDGFNLKVSEIAGDAVSIRLRERGEENRSRDGGGFILIQARGKIIYTRELPSWSGEYELRIPAGRMAKGINNIVAFDAEGKFVAERYIFIPPAAKEGLKLSYNNNAGRRTKITIGIQDPQGMISPDDVPEGSISVAAATGADNHITASEYLLLGSELTHASDAPMLKGSFPWLTPEGRDNFLLGIKSTWIHWNKISTGQWDPPVFPEEVNGRYLSVSLAGRRDQTAAGKLTAFLVAWGKRQSFQYATADSSGRFIFFLENKHETDEIIIKTDARDRNHPLIIEDSFSDSHLTNSFSPDTTPLPAVMHELDKLAARYQVRKIYGIPDSRIIDTAVREEQDLWRFYGIPDQELRLDDYISLSSMREILFELVRRLAVRSDRKEEALVIWDPVLKRSPALFIDLVPVDDAETILGLEPAHVKQIDIITGDYLFGEIVFPGILSVTTRKGNFSEGPLPANTLRIRYAMADPPSLFLSPDHSSEENSRIPDFRNTLFWEGDIKRDSTDGLSWELRSSDDSQMCEITVTLVDREGKLVSAREKIDLTVMPVF